MCIYIPGCVSQGVILLGTATKWLGGKKWAAKYFVCGLRATIHLHILRQKLNSLCLASLAHHAHT